MVHVIGITRLLLLLLSTVCIASCDEPGHPSEKPTSQSTPVSLATGTAIESGAPFPITAFDRTRAACLFFVGTDCPISNAYAPEIGRIIRDFEGQGVKFYVIYSDRELTVKSAADHSKAYGYDCPTVLDEHLEIARALGATTMPEVVLLPPDGAAVYQGRIDDRYPAIGAKRREIPTTRDLRDALTSFLAGQQIANPRTAPVGCRLDFPK